MTRGGGKRPSGDLESEIMAGAAAVFRGFVGVVADIAGLKTLVGSMGIRVHLFGQDGNFRMVTMAGLASRGFDLLGRRVFLMATLAIEPELLVFVGQKLTLSRPGGKTGP